MAKSNKRNELMQNILNYWWECIPTMKGDMAINILFEDITERYGVPYRNGWGWEDVLNRLTNSQLRKMYKEVLQSGILEKYSA